MTWSEDLLLLGNGEDHQLDNDDEFSTTFLSSFISAQNGDVTFDILDDITQLIKNESSNYFQELQPTPISTKEGFITIVPKLSVSEDLDLVNNSSLYDVVSWLAKEDNIEDGKKDTSVSTKGRVRNRSNNYSKDSNHKNNTSDYFSSFVCRQDEATSSSFRPIKKQRVAVSKQEVLSLDPLGGTDTSNDSRIRNSQKWDQRFQELLAFKEIQGHCSVPNIYPENPKLAQWVKRQRYQYKLKTDGKHSTLSDDRQHILDQVGFVWDSHEAVWMERFNELKQFWMEKGHTNVPSNYAKNYKLSIWVKCQRRQHKLCLAGTQSHMTLERILMLNSLGFEWNPRNL